jgi:hypothetical protein
LAKPCTGVYHEVARGKARAKTLIEKTETVKERV